MSSSADAQALAVGRAVLALLEALGIGSTVGPQVYSQHALPTGVTRGAFLERHRARVAAGIEGWSRTGKLRSVTAHAWALDVVEETTRRRKVPPANDDAELDARLGLRRRGVTR